MTKRNTTLETQPTDYDSDTIVFLAIIRHIVFLRETTIPYNGEITYSFYQEKISKQNLELLKIVCCLKKPETEDEQAKVDRLFILALS